jgi:hypothetical protein
MWQGTRQLFRPVIGRVSSRNSCRALCGKCIPARCFPPTPSTVRIPHHLVSGNAVRTCLYSTPAPKLSSMERIKVVLREYGTVGVVFHTVISLASLGTCYLVVDSGVDVGKVLEYFNVQSSSTTKGASTFAVAYVLHKMFLPVRAGITVASVPLIVRWLRTKGWVKGVAKVSPK